MHEYDSSFPVPLTGSFPATQWSMVERAGLECEQGIQARAALLRRYQPAILSHLVRRLRIDAHWAEDLSQEFIVSVLEKNLFARADRARGKFRSFLLVSLDNFVRDVRDRLRAQKHGGQAVASLDEECEISDGGDSPSLAFYRDYARQVVERAVSEMRAEYEAGQNPEIWRVFEARIVLPLLYGSDPVPYGELCARFGLGSPTQAGNLLITGKRAFTRHLRAVVLAAEGPDADVDAEIRDLRDIFSSSPRI